MNELRANLARAEDCIATAMYKLNMLRVMRAAAITYEIGASRIDCAVVH